MNTILSVAPPEITAPPLTAYGTAEGPTFGAAYSATNGPTFGIAYSAAFGVSYGATYDTAFDVTYGATYVVTYNVAFCTAFLRVTIALRGHWYIIPHPTIYILPKFDANWLKNNGVFEWAPF